MFSWEPSDGDTIKGVGYTRDISSGGVFVLTSDRLLSGTSVKLEVSLPAPRETSSGASLMSQGRIVRSEETGFAAAADTGFRMRFPETLCSELSFGKVKGDGGSKHEVGSEEIRQKQLDVISRFWM
jgi:hypothetical protein